MAGMIEVETLAGDASFSAYRAGPDDAAAAVIVIQDDIRGQRWHPAQMR